MLALFTAVLIDLAALLVVLAAATILFKARRYWSEIRRARLEAALRPKLFAFLAEDEADPADFMPASRRELRVWQLLAAGLLTKLRGTDREALTGLLEANGALDRARRHTRHPSPVWRARAAELLGASGLQAALSDLRRLLRDRDPDVRAVAVRAIGKLGCPEAGSELLATLESDRPVAAGVVSMALLHLGPGVVGPLRDALAPGHTPLARRTAAELLGRIGEHDATDALVEVLRGDPNAEVRAAAVTALARTGLPRVADALVQAVGGDEALEVRAAAAWGLGELGGPEAAPALEAAAQSAAHMLARAAAEALARIGGTGHELLERLALANDRGAAEAREALATVPA